MRNIIVATGLTLLLAAGAVQAREPGFSFGVRGQATTNWFTGELGDAFDDREMGWGAGLVFEWQMTESFGLGIATLYSRIDGEGILDLDPDPVDSDLTVEWMEIPVYAKFGEGLHLVVGATSRLQIASDFGDDAALVELEDGFEDAEFSALLGIGLDVPIASNVLQFGVDFQFGLNDAVDVEEVSGRVNSLVLRAAILF